MAEFFRTAAWVVLFAATLQVFFPQPATELYNRYGKQQYEKWQQGNPQPSPRPSVSPSPASDRFGLKV
jgi:hypothetical protein